MEFLKELLQAITVEPVIIIHSTATIFSQYFFVVLSIRKLCHKLNLDKNLCDNIKDVSELLNDTKTTDGPINDITNPQPFWSYTLETAVSLIVVCIACFLSDLYKRRKLFLMLPLLGQLVMITCTIFYGLFEDLPPEFLTVMHGATSLLGGGGLLNSLSAAYVIDITSAEERTFRIGVIYAVTVFTMMALMHLASVGLPIDINPITVLLLCGLLLIFALWYLNLRIEKETAIFDIPWRQFRVGKMFSFDGRRHNFFYNSMLILIALFVYFVDKICFEGESQFFFLHLLMNLFWTPNKVSFMADLVLISDIIGLTVVVYVFTRILRWNDYSIMLVSYLCHIIGNLIQALTNNEILIYLSLSCKCIATCAEVAVRSLASKLVFPKNAGAIQFLFSLRDIFEAVCSTFAVDLYRLILEKTSPGFPTAFLYVGVVVYSSSFCLVLWILSRNSEIKRCIHVAPKTET